MASTYPATLDSLATNKADGTTTATDHPAHHNDLADAVNRIEAELGREPSCNLGSVQEVNRLRGDFWAPTGSLAVNMPDRSNASATVSQTAANATSFHGGMVLLPGVTYTNVNAYCTGAGSGTVTTFWFALVNQSDRTVIERTANSTSLPTLNAPHTRALQSTVTVSTPTPVWVAWGSQIATQPSFAGNSALATFNFQAPIMTGNSALTSTLPSVGAVLAAPSAGVAGRVYFWLT